MNYPVRDIILLSVHNNFPNLEKEYNDLPNKHLLDKWIDNNIVPIKHINTSCTSYGLKHLFEYSKGGFYVTDNAFKYAMLKQGYMTADSLSKSVCFNVSQRSITKLRKKVYSNENN